MLSDTHALPPFTCTHINTRTRTHTQGDVLASIMEVADEELSKPAKAINRTRLQSLLEMGASRYGARGVRRGATAGPAAAARMPTAGRAHALVSWQQRAFASGGAFLCSVDDILAAGCAL